MDPTSPAPGAPKTSSHQRGYHGFLATTGMAVDQHMTVALDHGE
jgi:hypothetical protein